MICRADTRAGVPGEVLLTGRGRPDLCRCNPEARLEVLAGEGTP